MVLPGRQLHELPPADPPGCICTEFMSPAIIELLGGSDEADIAFLDQVQEWYATPHIFFCNAYHQTRVGSNKMFTSCPAVLYYFSQFHPTARLTFPRANSSRAIRPRSIRWASSTSWVAVSKGTRLTSLRYNPIVSSVSILAR